MRLIVLLFILFCSSAVAQTEYHFSKLTVENGLSDAHVQAIGQDKYGFMWFGTVSGVSRYDGRNIVSFTHLSEDTTTILSEMAMSFGSDTEGRFFIGFVNGLVEFDFNTQHFKRIKAAQGKHITSITSIKKDLVLLTTTEGVAEFNPTNQTIHFLDIDNLLKTSIAGSFYKNGVLYLASNKGLILYDVKQRKARKAPIPALDSAILRAVAVDDDNNFWITAHGKNRLIRVSPDFSKTENYDRFFIENEPSESSVLKIIKDLKGRIWICTKYNGLLQYSPETNGFIRHIHNPDRNWSLNNHALISLFCNQEGIIWVGGGGVSFFHPDKILFSTIQPFITDLAVRQRRYARCVTEDKDDNLWFGTRDGLVKYDVKTQKRRYWRNEGAATNVLTGNTVLDVYCDEENRIWVGTTQGLNRYDPKTDQMAFLSGTNSFPKGNYKYFYRDRDGVLWFCLLSENGLLFLGKDQIVHDISAHPQLKRFAGMEVWTMFQDSKGRFWYAFDEKGLGMYDPQSQKTEFWSADTEGGQKIASNIMIDIKEDKKGIIWVSSFSGLMSIDYEKKAFKIHRHALLKGSSYALYVDGRDRLWVSTGNGLVVLDSRRQQFTKFDIHDGLPALEFTEQSSYQTPSGKVILSTSNGGYVRFDPLDYTVEKKLVPFYVAAFSAKGIERRLLEDTGNLNLSIDLNADENAFQFSLVCLNYFNPNHTWFAYKLEGLDKDWQYTQDPKAVYTNVAGGNYTFRYKATTNLNDWDIAEKTIAVHVATVFYKSWWFWSVIFGLTVFGIYRFYRFRENQKQQVFDLLSKAQLLEKEKAVMQYEGLKQQLNPHFLFNSLTSLSSLIEIDPSVASHFLDNMSKSYRYILKSSESETVPLRDEVRFAQNFVELQNIRFEKGLEVHFDINEEDLDRKIVPVTLQNMIENATKHNIIDQESPLKIKIYTVRENSSGEGGYLIVENNLQKKNFVESSNKRGLSNLISLYRYFSDKPVSTVETHDTFYVKIPLI